MVGPGARNPVEGDGRGEGLMDRSPTRRRIPEPPRDVVGTVLVEEQAEREGDVPRTRDREGEDVERVGEGSDRPLCGGIEDRPVSEMRLPNERRSGTRRRANAGKLPICAGIPPAALLLVGIGDIGIGKEEEGVRPVRVGERPIRKGDRISEGVRGNEAAEGHHEERKGMEHLESHESPRSKVSPRIGKNVSVKSTPA